jgi:hypothetical protein
MHAQNRGERSSGTIIQLQLVAGDSGSTILAGLKGPHSDMQTLVVRELLHFFWYCLRLFRHISDNKGSNGRHLGAF